MRTNLHLQQSGLSPSGSLIVFSHLLVLDSDGDLLMLRLDKQPPEFLRHPVCPEFEDNLLVDVAERLDFEVECAADLSDDW